MGWNEGLEGVGGRIIFPFCLSLEEEKCNQGRGTPTVASLRSKTLQTGSPAPKGLMPLRCKLESSAESSRHVE